MRHVRDRGDVLYLEKKVDILLLYAQKDCLCTDITDIAKMVSYLRSNVYTKKPKIIEY